MLLSVPLIVVEAPPKAADVRTGKFCRVFAPVSASPGSLAVTPVGPRSMPRPELANSELPRMATLRLLAESTRTPAPVLNAIRLQSPVQAPGVKEDVPPIDPVAPAVTRTPWPPFGTAAAPLMSVPMKLPRKLPPLPAPLNSTPSPALPEMTLREDGEVPPIVSPCSPLEKTGWCAVAITHRPGRGFESSRSSQASSSFH